MRAIGGTVGGSAIQRKCRHCRRRFHTHTHTDDAVIRDGGTILHFICLPKNSDQENSTYGITTCRATKEAGEHERVGQPFGVLKTNAVTAREQHSWKLVKELSKGVKNAQRIPKEVIKKLA